jgi:hypothetical protein
MFLEQARVSRKTPKDGKLEITESAAARLGAPPSQLTVVVNGERGTGAVDAMSCTCRGDGDTHTHHFLRSELLKRLPADTDVSLELLEDGTTVEVASPRGNR